MSSPAPPPLWSCCAEVTTCAWPLLCHLTCLRFIESAGLTAVPYGRDWQAQLRDEDFVRMIQNPLSAIHEAIEYVAQVAAEKTATLMSLTNGADLLVAGINEQGLAANVAEYYGIPLAALHSLPGADFRARGRRIRER